VKNGKDQDWYSVGCALVNEVAEKVGKFAERYPEVGLDIPGIKFHAAKTEMRAPDDHFINAVQDYFGGNPAALIEYLKSNGPIGRAEKFYLGDAFEAEAAEQAEANRPLHSQVRFAATVARALYAEWQARAKSAHVNCRGHSGDMKDLTARFVANGIFHGCDLDEDKVRELMNRSKKRIGHPDDRSSVRKVSIMGLTARLVPRRK
jgi:hypothetical protein